MSGPVIISDDGGPPLTIQDDRGHKKTVENFTAQFKIFRAYEFMHDLENANGEHLVLHGGAISAITVKQGGGTPVPQTVGDVEITGSNGQSVKIHSAANFSIMKNLNAMTDQSLPGWGFYTASDLTITAVKIGGVPVKLTGGQIRVTISF
jgi:hypothetical protein